jgi:DNA-binding SARP family transcriptional activator
LRLRVEVFGGLTVFGASGDPLSIAGSCRPILGYLLTHRRRRISRTELAETLWAEHDGNHARRCLSTALWRLKKSTGTGMPLLNFHGAEEVSFNWDPAWVDSVALELRVEPMLRVKPAMMKPKEIGRLQRGVRLYAGTIWSGSITNGHGWNVSACAISIWMASTISRSPMRRGPIGTLCSNGGAASIGKSHCARMCIVF